MHMRVDYKGMGRRIRTLRKQKGLTQAALAEEISRSLTYVGCIERNTKTPSIQTIVDICFALECSLDDLFIDTLPEKYDRSSPSKLRQPDYILRNTLTNWLCTDLPDMSLESEKPADLRALPSLGFSALDEELPMILTH